MKYRKKLIVCVLIGLTVLINSCRENKLSVQLLRSTNLDFPSASAIEFYNNRLYVFGDDARSVVVLSNDHSIIDSVAITGAGSYRINKEEKHDIESAIIVVHNGSPHLLGIGSMSASKRWGVVGYDLKAGAVYSTAFFDSGKHFAGIESINIEGSCAADPYIVFSNRANLSHPVNHLLVWNKYDSIAVKRVMLPASETVVGVSGLYYVKNKDLLLFTASEEATTNAISDGAIGESYLGIIQDFTEKLKHAELKPDSFIKLSTIDKVFTKEKVESVCMEGGEGNALILHLVSDNDNGRSKIFKVKLML